MHSAAIGGQLETIKFLLKQNAPLEVKNIYGGTVLGHPLVCGSTLETRRLMLRSSKY
jgi:ankyrin repeat protein